MERIALSEQFQACLECSVCHSFLTKPLFNCRKGHSICNSCQYSKCPVCEGQIFRNFSLEQVLGHITTKCRHKGCGEVVSIVDYKKHHQECEFNEAVSCFECSEQRKDIVTHLILDHDYKEILHESGSVRSFSGPRSLWEKDTKWPKGIWRIDQEPVIVIAQCYQGVFYIELFKVRKEPVVVKLKVQSDEAYVTFKGPIPLIGTQSSACFNLEVQSLLQDFAERSSADIIELLVRVSKI